MPTTLADELSPRALADAFVVKPWRTADGDPLAAEHAALGMWVAEAIEAQGPNQYWAGVELKTLESDRALLAANPEEGRKLALAAVLQVQHWDGEVARMRAASPAMRPVPHGHPKFRSIWAQRQCTVSAWSSLMRRNLPFERADLVSMLGYFLHVASFTFFSLPAPPFARALERYAAAHAVDPALRESIRKFAARLQEAHTTKELKRAGTALAQLCDGDVVVKEENMPPEAVRSTPRPAPAGDRGVQRRLKISLGMLEEDASAEEAVPEVRVGPDQFAMLEASPLAAQHELLSAVLAEALNVRSYHERLHGLHQDERLVDPSGKLQSLLLVAAAERHHEARIAPQTAEAASWMARDALHRIVKGLAGSTPQFDRNPLFDFLLYLCVSPGNGRMGEAFDQQLFAAIDLITDNGANLTEGERFVLHLWRNTRITGPALGVSPPHIARLTRWIGDGFTYFLVPGEHWTDALNADLAALPPMRRTKWTALLKHCLTATTARPSARWRKAAIEWIAAIGEKEVWHFFERWMPLVTKGRSDGLAGETRNLSNCIHDENADALRGLLWVVPLLAPRDGQARLLAGVALTAYKKIPGVGPRAVKVGNAAVYALSQMVTTEAVGQLAMLKVRVRFGTAQKEVEKAFDAAAIQLALPRDQVEEMSVPDCGLEQVGEREEAFGGYRAQVLVTGTDAEIRWFSPEGKALKAVPAAVKKEHAETLKDLQGDTKDLQAMLSAQRDRIDGLFLEQKTWRADLWRERYVDHPLVGTIARRLIWSVDETPVTMADGVALDLGGSAVEVPASAVISLWHPVGRSIDEVVAWRRRIEALGIVQPFKQAHREIYLLTDAERNTNVYSNRFAAHILRQHQFNALCGARRWKNKLRLLVDGEYPPATRELPLWNLRAEFWVEGIGTDYGADTNESGVYLRLASDQVRFYRTGAAPNRAHAGGGGYVTHAGGGGTGDINAPIPLSEVPALVFSEVMRDVDLFVGVASIGNDPAWQDGGNPERYAAYWHNYSFGELSGTALSRREALQSLLPRLKIADRCTLVDRFLQVRGTRCTYKIHLGSGNILMEPNDEYLCIVPDASSRGQSPEVYLPFEGDRTFSIILSKAFLLAEDAKIKDPLINSQIHRHFIGSA